MRIALYHNLPQGGALRLLKETIVRSAREHEYHLYRIVRDNGEIVTSDSIPDGVTAVHDIAVQAWRHQARRSTPALPAPPLDEVAPPQPWGRPSGRLWALRSAADVLALWRGEPMIAARIDADGYDLCFVHSCRLTQAPSLLAHLRTPSVYYAQEPRRLAVEQPIRRNAFDGLPAYEKAAMFVGDAVLQRRDRRAVDRSSALVCNSLFSAEVFYRVYGRTATLVRPGVDQEAFRPSGAKRENYVLSVGALTASKGHTAIVEAVSFLPRRSRPAVIVAYGRAVPGYEEMLRNLASRRGVELELQAAISDSELVRLYSAAQATVCAARLEPFGLTPLESLSCGTPVVAVNQGGFRETVSDGLNGLLVPPTPTGLAHGIDAVLSGHLPGHANEFRATIAEHTWDKTVDELHKLFRAIASH